MTVTAHSSPVLLVKMNTVSNSLANYTSLAHILAGIKHRILCTSTVLT